MFKRQGTYEGNSCCCMAEIHIVKHNQKQKTLKQITLHHKNTHNKCQQYRGVSLNLNSCTLSKLLIDILAQYVNHFEY